MAARKPATYVVHPKTQEAGSETKPRLIHGTYGEVCDYLLGELTIVPVDVAEAVKLGRDGTVVEYVVAKTA